MTNTINTDHKFTQRRQSLLHSATGVVSLSLAFALYESLQYIQIEYELNEPTMPYANTFSMPITETQINPDTIPYVFAPDTHPIALEMNDHVELLENFNQPMSFEFEDLQPEIELANNPNDIEHSVTMEDIDLVNQVADPSEDSSEDSLPEHAIHPAVAGLILVSLGTGFFILDNQVNTPPSDSAPSDSAEKILGIFSPENDDPSASILSDLLCGDEATCHIEFTEDGTLLVNNTELYDVSIEDDQLCINKTCFNISISENSFTLSTDELSETWSSSDSDDGF